MSLGRLSNIFRTVAQVIQLATKVVEEVEKMVGRRGPGFNDVDGYLRPTSNINQ